MSESIRKPPKLDGFEGFEGFVECFVGSQVFLGHGAIPLVLWRRLPKQPRSEGLSLLWGLISAPTSKARWELRVVRAGAAAVGVVAGVFTWKGVAVPEMF